MHTFKLPELLHLFAYVRIERFSVTVQIHPRSSGLQIRNEKKLKIGSLLNDRNNSNREHRSYRQLNLTKKLS